MHRYIATLIAVGGIVGQSHAWVPVPSVPIPSAAAKWEANLRPPPSSIIERLSQIYDGMRRRAIMGPSSTRLYAAGLGGDIKRNGWRPANDSFSSSSGAAFDPKNPFFTVDYGEEAAVDEKQAEEEWLLNLSREDPDAYTETFSSAAERGKRARASRDRYDFTCLTVEEVAKSYQVPISWIGDALCNFGVIPPVQWTARMGDLIDGDQAFALLEAMHGWDHAVMYDMYTWDSLRELTSSYDLEISNVLQVCDEEGFALPFGLRSHLRVEQFARLMRRVGLANQLPDDVRTQFPDPEYPS